MDISKLNQVDILFSDIFDTIIIRSVHPEYIKNIFSKKLKEHYDLPLTSDQLYKKRFDIEARLCQKNKNDGFDLEFHFYAFCKELYIELRQENFLEDETYPAFKSICSKIEIAVEYSIQKIDEDILAIFEEAKRNHTKVYCLSDFYLPKEMILELFKLHKINDYFDDIFVSSDYLLTKRTGRLYEKVLTKTCKKKKILMIGDNKHSDIKMAKNYGLDTFWIDRKKEYEYYEHHKSNSSYINLLNEINVILKENKVFEEERYFFQEISIVFSYFITNLVTQLLSKKIKEVFLFSREGEFLKKMLDTYLIMNNIHSISTHYLVVSRKSTFIASLDSLKNEDFETIFRQYRSISISSFLKSLNFSKMEIQYVTNSCKINLDEKKDDLPTSNDYKLLLKNKTFTEIYESKRTEQKRNLKQYIEEFGVKPEVDGLVVVDIGWKGTIQDHLFKLYEKNINIDGYYLGLVIDLMENKKNKKTGLVFDYKSPNKYDSVFKENIPLFEVLLGASHGSADFYVSKDNRIEVVTHEEVNEQKMYQYTISPMQEIIYQKFYNLIQIFSYSHFSILDMKKEVASIHAKMIYFPKKVKVRFFRNLYHYENFGMFEFSTFDKYKTTSLITRLQYIKQFIISPKNFLEFSFWKAAALDDIGLLFIYKLKRKKKYKELFKDIK